MNARDIALAALVRVERDDAFASAALAAILDRSACLDPRDRALATELTYGVLRWRGALDRALSACAPRGIGRLDPEVLAALRIAVYQVVHLERIPPAAAISAAVDQVRARRGERMAGFANGLLRAVCRDEHGALALGRDVRASHPGWLVDLIAAELPAEEVDAALAANNRPPPTCLRVNLRRTTRESLADQLRSRHPLAVLGPGRHVETCLRVEGIGDPHATDAYRYGWYSIQDEAAQVVAALCVDALRGKRGVRVLDACAGRGGKTAAIAEMLDPPFTIDAVDRSAEKLAHLNEEFARLGLPAPGCAAIDLEVGIGGLEPEYDLVLLDAPCSGTGVIGRRPDIRWRRTLADVGRLAEVQVSLLRRLEPLLAPGGTLIYSVCSIAPLEGRLVVHRHVHRHRPTLRIVAERLLWPHRDDTDGFFVATLEDAARGSFGRIEP